jgi:hypothetical protein
MTQLTDLETQALGALFLSAAGNGHDFGIIEEVRWDDRKALGGLITSLQAKGFIHVHPTMIVNPTIKFRRDRRVPGGFREIHSGGKPVTQFTWEESKRAAIRAMCA